MPIADMYTTQAEKAAAGAGGGFSFFGGRTEKLENAVELYTQAANAFRMQKAGIEAGQCFEKAAAMQAQKLNEPDDAANTLIEAFKSYRKDDPEDGARCLEQAIAHYTMKGNFRRAAGHKQSLAELYEVELGDEKRAAEAYETAASWYENDNAEAYVLLVDFCEQVLTYSFKTGEQALPQVRRPVCSCIRLPQSHRQL